MNHPYARSARLATAVLSLACGTTDEPARRIDEPPRSEPGDLPPVYINELMASNSGAYRDVMEDADDWIELYNAGEAEAYLEGYGISDNADDPFKAVLPAEAVLSPWGTLLLWADDEPIEGWDHLPFALNSARDSVWLSSPQEELMDFVRFELAITNQSFARIPNGTGDFVRCDDPTPGESNDIANCE